MTGGQPVTLRSKRDYYTGRWPDWLDHPWRVVRQGRVVICVAEPYSLTGDEMRDISATAERSGWLVMIGRAECFNIYYPASSIPVVFYRPEAAGLRLEPDAAAEWAHWQRLAEEALA